MYECMCICASRKNIYDGANGKEPACQCRRLKRDAASILGQEDALEEGRGTHSSTLAWRIPRDRGAWRAAVHGSQRVGHDWRDSACTRVCMYIWIAQVEAFIRSFKWRILEQMKLNLLISFTKCLKLLEQNLEMKNKEKIESKETKPF